MPQDLTVLPQNLPVPEDDGAADHLQGVHLPAVSLLATDGKRVELAALSGTRVIYFYPMTGRPDALPLVGWNDIPGARGCTPQSCAFRDHFHELQALGADVYGLSAQIPRNQQEAQVRLRLPFHLLSDTNLVLKDSLRLPTFSFNGVELYKRMTWVVRDGVIVKVFYPVFPPDQNASDVVAWLKTNP